MTYYPADPRLPVLAAWLDRIHREAIESRPTVDEADVLAALDEVDPIRAGGLFPDPRTTTDVPF